MLCFLSALYLFLGFPLALPVILLLIQPILQAFYVSSHQEWRLQGIRVCLSCFGEFEAEVSGVSRSCDIIRSTSRDSCLQPNK